MLRKSFVLLVVGTVIFFVCSVSSADVPDSINYQGKLTTATGGCVNDTVQMTFTIYADESGTVSEWSETQTQVDVKEGIFNVLLGSVNPLPASIFDGSAKYLGVQVESDPEMTPLKPMVSVGYAFRSAESDTAEFALSATPDDDWDIDTAGFNVYRLTGNVGIGTTSPDYKLHVNGSGNFDDGIKTGDAASGDGIRFGKKYSYAADINPIVTCYSGYVWWDYSENELKVTETNAYNNHCHAAGYRDQGAVKDFYDTWITSGGTATVATLTVNGNWATFEITSEGPDAGYIHIHCFYSNSRLVAHYWYRYQ